MSRISFSSDRERRLWTWTLALVVGIYLTLGLASSLAEIINNRTLNLFGFLTGMLLVGLTVLTQGLKTRPKGIEIGVALGIGMVYFMVALRMALPERSHLMEYSVVAVFIYEALTERVSQGRRVHAPWLLAIVLTSLIGAIDECIQLVLPSREFEVDDILFNCLAALMAVIGMVVLNWARRVAAMNSKKKASSSET